MKESNIKLILASVLMALAVVLNMVFDSDIPWVLVVFAFYILF